MNLRSSNPGFGAPLAALAAGIVLAIASPAWSQRVDETPAYDPRTVETLCGQLVLIDLRDRTLGSDGHEVTMVESHPDRCTALEGELERVLPSGGTALYDVVIRAFALLPDRAGVAPPVLVIAGEGAARPGLERLGGELGVSDRVFLPGWRDDPEDLYAHFACFVLESWSEGTSVSLLEAMASGLPPVVTSVGGNPAVLGGELKTQAVPPGDPAALAAGIVAGLAISVVQPFTTTPLIWLSG